MKQWIEHHKRILQKAAGALLAFMIGICLVFMIHPVQTLPKDRLLSLSRMQEDSQQFVAPSSKEPALEDLLLLDLARGFRVIIMIQANSQVNTRVLELLPKFKIKKMNRWCAV